MSKIPIHVVKYKEENIKSYGFFNESSEVINRITFQIVVTEKNETWNKCYNCSVDELTKFRDELTELINSVSWHEKLNIDATNAGKIDAANNSDQICQSCSFRQSRNCLTCLCELQSPLERKLYSKLLECKFYFEVQHPIDVFGKKASIRNFKEKYLRLKYNDLLTQVDFYLPNGKTPICIYTDGHTYHERTEEQAKRDRSIDRKLQELGFKVLRFTGKEINDTLEKAVNQIKKFAELKN